MSINLEALRAEFPREAVSWRAQSVTKDGTKALALAYIDARDVMRRLDEVCGPENWQDSYEETPKGRVVCTIRIKIGDEWVGKSDGAGDTAVEAEKGGLSDAFKRAAVKWGIGRYLYDLDAPWVPCECSEWNGKKQWKKWTADPWSFVRGATGQVQRAPKDDGARDVYARLSKANRELPDEAAFNKFWSQANVQAAFNSLPADWARELTVEKNDKAAELQERAELASGDDFPGFDLGNHLDRIAAGASN